jgi:hypothetical protein
MSVAVDTSGLSKMATNFAEASGLKAQFVQANLAHLGTKLVAIIRESLEQHRYRGELQDSVSATLEPERLTVGPRKKYKGGWDAGWILQTGTGPIERVPFAPIKAWAEHRGLPAGPVWYKIKTVGVSGHPWLERTIDRPDFGRALDQAALKTGMTLYAYGILGVPGSQEILNSTMYGS